MKLKRNAVVSLLKELGVKTCDTWPIERLTKRLNTLPKLIETEEAEAKSADGKALLKKILAAVKAEDEIELIDDAKAPAAKEEKASAKPDKKASKKAAKEEESEDEDDEDSEDDESEDEEEDEKPAKKSKKDKKASKKDDDEEEESEDDEEDDSDDEDEKPSKKSKKDKKEKKKGNTGFEKVGITDFIRARMLKTSKKNPITIDQMTDELHEKFPDREPEKMHKTAQGQMSYFLRDTNKSQKDPLDIKRADGGGFYVRKEKKEE